MRRERPYIRRSFLICSFYFHIQRVNIIPVEAAVDQTFPREQNVRVDITMSRTCQLMCLAVLAWNPGVRGSYSEVTFTDDYDNNLLPPPAPSEKVVQVCTMSFR